MGKTCVIPEYLFQNRCNKKPEGELDDAGSENGRYNGSVLITLILLNKLV